MGAFGSKKTAKELMRENQRTLNRAIRELDRERTSLEQQESKLKQDIKKMAKKEQMVRGRRNAKQGPATRRSGRVLAVRRGRGARRGVGELVPDPTSSPPPAAFRSPSRSWPRTSCAQEIIFPSFTGCGRSCRPSSSSCRCGRQRRAPHPRLACDAPPPPPQTCKSTEAMTSAMRGATRVRS